MAPSPMLRVFDNQVDSTSNNPITSSHAMVVDKLKGILYPSLSPAISDHSMSDSGEDGSEEEDSDSEISEYDNLGEPDDSLTLDQFLSGLRKEALVQRVPESLALLPKKGRLDQGGNEV